MQAYCMSYTCLEYIFVIALDWQTQPMQLWELQAITLNRPSRPHNVRAISQIVFSVRKRRTPLFDSNKCVKQVSLWSFLTS